MLNAPSLDDLARRIRERSGPGQPQSRGPYILFLGEGCAKAAGAPSREDVAREALKTFKHESPEASMAKSAVDLFGEFSAYTSSLSQSQFARMLRSLYATVPVPSFYQDLALLVRERFFPLIVTMNFDTLLEQAFSVVGIRSSEYAVTTFGTQRIPRQRGTTADSAEPLTHLVKLHGDLAQDIAHVSPQEIENALGRSRHWIKSDLVGDLIIVAHVMSDDPIDRWLAHSPQREVWWVSQDPPADRARLNTWAREVQEITGDLGRPLVFFSQLTHRLLRAPEAEAMDEPLESVGQVGTEGLGTATADTLRREIRRSQSVLSNLDQERVPGQENPQLQAQLKYQKRQLSRLEDRIRSIPEIKPRVIEIVKELAARIRSVPTPAGESTSFTEMADYIQNQADTLAQELGRDKPNQILVSASLGATLAIADRLHTEYDDLVVSATDIKELAALVPTVAGKVVL